jgi:hypothetical protein
MSTDSMPLRGGAPKRRDLRKSRRYSVDDGILRVSWLGLDGTLKVVQQARVVNVSEDGIAVELPAPALLASRIGLEASKHRLQGEGTVKRRRSRSRSRVRRRNKAGSYLPACGGLGGSMYRVVVALTRWRFSPDG